MLYILWYLSLVVVAVVFFCLGAVMGRKPAEIEPTSAPPNSDYAAALNMALAEFDGMVLHSWVRARVRDAVLRIHAQSTIAKDTANTANDQLTTLIRLSESGALSNQVALQMAVNEAIQDQLTRK